MEEAAKEADEEWREEITPLEEEIIKEIELWEAEVLREDINFEEGRAEVKARITMSFDSPYIRDDREKQYERPFNLIREDGKWRLENPIAVFKVIVPEEDPLLDEIPPDQIR